MSELQLGGLQGKAGLARFGEPGQNGDDAATIKPNVPLPGSYRWERVVPLEIPVDWYEQSAANAGTSLRELGVIDDSSSVISVDETRLVNFYRRVLPATARPSLRHVAEIGAPVYPQLPDTGDGSSDSAAIPVRVRSSDREDVEIQRLRREAYLHRLAEIQVAELLALHDRVGPTVTIPTASVGDSIQPVEYSMADAGVPRIALVETWELRSFLGDYGLGRTLQTFSLLPGERTTITVETWRTEAATREDATSVFDSSDIASQSRFGSTLSRQSGAGFQQQGGWAASIGGGVSAGVNLGIVSFGASIQGGYAAHHQEARQAFVASVAETTREHAAQVNNSRRQTVESTSSTTTASGMSTITVRELANTNLRRVLNFVFRELNQSYETLTVLRNVKVAFYNGNIGSAEIVALADVGRLLDKYVVEAHRSELARILLGLVAQCLDHQGTPVPTLQVGTRPKGNVYEWQDARLTADGTLDHEGDPFDGSVSWRFKPGMLGEGNTRANGVITDISSVVLRTDNVIGEALLGQADALDPYASELQALDLQSRQADIDHRKATTRKANDALDLVRDLEAKDKVDAYERILGDKPDIEVVPVAAVSNGDESQS